MGLFCVQYLHNTQLITIFATKPYIMKYFTINELTKSSTADRLGIKNAPDAAQVQNLTQLVDNLLDPLREKWGKPIVVNSGFRCPALNKAVNGAATSQHLTGNAIDIDTGDRQQNKLLFEMIRNNFEYDQVINESNFSWVHVSYKKGANRKQVLAL